MKKYILIPFLIALSIFSCEKDDICAATTATTPRLLVSFNDNILRDNQKNVTGFLAVGFDLDTALENYSVITTADAILPLRTDATETKYRFFLDYEIDDNGTPDDETDDFQTGNEDIITINYTIKEVFVSNACGYKVQYENVSITIEPDGDNWLLFQEALNENLIIADETTTHFNLYH
ncbi:DUF6452 family protein [Aurantibacter sp.]|uniref:DUF6452 family protein n=1 Tax=Aurantibacter sp. TaxID=2807103 RepID=UPI0035C7D6C6